MKCILTSCVQERERGREREREGGARTVDSSAAVWGKSKECLPLAQMKLTLNAACDTLPHNANLSLWMTTCLEHVNFVENAKPFAMY